MAETYQGEEPRNSEWPVMRRALGGSLLAFSGFVFASMGYGVINHASSQNVVVEKQPVMTQHGPEYKDVYGESQAVTVPGVAWGLFFAAGGLALLGRRDEQVPIAAPDADATSSVE